MASNGDTTSPDSIEKETPNAMINSPTVLEQLSVNELYRHSPPFMFVPLWHRRDFLHSQFLRSYA